MKSAPAGWKLLEPGIQCPAQFLEPQGLDNERVGQHHEHKRVRPISHKSWNETLSRSPAERCRERGRHRQFRHQRANAKAYRHRQLQGMLHCRQICRRQVAPEQERMSCFLATPTPPDVLERTWIEECASPSMASQRRVFIPKLMGEPPRIIL